MYLGKLKDIAMADKLGEVAPLKFLAAEAVAGNEDLLLQILLRVPVRPLIRFKVVSKHWKAIISGEEFGRNHTRIASQTGKTPHSPSGLYFYTRGDSTQLHSVSLCANNQRMSLPSLSIDSILLKVAAHFKCKFKVLQSCNGLLLCSITRPFPEHRFRGRDRDVESYMVLNPNIMETKVVPYPKRNFVDVDEIQCCRFIFDPKESPHFKVVCLKDLGPQKSHKYNTLHSRPHEILVYSSKSDSWRLCGNFTPPKGIISDSGVLFNGVIYWIGCNDMMLHFHIDSEKMTTSKMPQRTLRGDRLGVKYFGEWRGHLHLILGRERFLAVFEMDKDTFMWSVKHKFNLDRVTSAFPEVGPKRRDIYSDDDSDSNDYFSQEYVLEFYFIVLSFISGDNEEDSSLVLAIPGKVIRRGEEEDLCLPGKVISYNLFHKSIEVLGQFEYNHLGGFTWGIYTGHQYIESLSPFKEFSLGKVQSCVIFCRMLKLALPSYYS